jgi:hypothetical protein
MWSNCSCYCSCYCNCSCCCSRNCYYLQLLLLAATATACACAAATLFPSRRMDRIVGKGKPAQTPPRSLQLMTRPLILHGATNAGKWPSGACVCSIFVRRPGKQAIWIYGMANAGYGEHIKTR